MHQLLYAYAEQVIFPHLPLPAPPIATHSTDTALNCAALAKPCLSLCALMEECKDEPLPSELIDALQRIMAAPLKDVYGFSRESNSHPKQQSKCPPIGLAQATDAPPEVRRKAIVIHLAHCFCGFAQATSISLRDLLKTFCSGTHRMLIRNEEQVIL
jgi:hypothetical protein